MELEGIILDIDYIILGERGIIRFAIKTNEKVYELIDKNFYPYFYLIPINDRISKEMLSSFEIPEAKVRQVEEKRAYLLGKEVRVFQIFTDNPRNIPALSEAMSEFGERYEHDIVFWKRYIIEKIFLL